MILKTAGCIFILCACVGTGFLAAGELIRRIEDLRSIRSIAFLLQGDIRFGNTELPEALKNAARRHQGKLSEIFIKVALHLETYSGGSFQDVWNQAVEETMRETSFSKKDRLMLEEFSKNLGYLDKEMQLSTIDGYLHQLDGRIEELSKTSGEKVRLYRSLGVLAGILVIVLIL